ncbi:hypothetical protein HYS28_02715 [Candidatus Uhrbacteria bacterium]|nr:hypothetical protein [Candidatus Uhrbacteria bacterium]
MAERLRALAHVFEKPDGFSAAVGEEVIEVSVPVSTAAVLYEKVRNTLEYQEEHLLRRGAIERFFQRHLGEQTALSSLSGDLLRELVWAKYLPNKAVPTHLADKVAAVVAKYDTLFKAAEGKGDARERISGFVLDTLATEVEYTIAPPHHDEALASYMYEEMRERTEWDPAYGLSDEAKDLRLFIAVHRTLLKSNQETLRFRVLSLYYPDWPGASTPERINEIAANLVKVADMVDGESMHPLTDRVSRMLRRRAGVFRVVRDVIDHHPEHFHELLEDPDALDRQVGEALHHRTDLFRTRLRRTVVRAILFLFITKMLLALVMEVPYDLLVVGELAMGPLLINILFPPFFLALLSLTVTIPEKRNTDDYRAAVRALVVHADHPVLNLRIKKETRSAWATIFNVLYAGTFIFVYGVIASFLHNVGFHALSIGLFLFFLSLVTFFGIRIRSSTRDIVALDARSGIIGTAFDIFMLPIVRAGSWLSVKVAKINVSPGITGSQPCSY